MMCRFAAVALVVLCSGASGHGAESSGQNYVAAAVDLDIVPFELGNFIEALKQNGVATIKEPGCRQYDILQSAEMPNRIHIYEVFENEAAMEAHLASEHFKTYQAHTAQMVIKRQGTVMTPIALNSKTK
jgi:quinol monooxygenase YgiN